MPRFAKGARVLSILVTRVQVVPHGFIEPTYTANWSRLPTSLLCEGRLLWGHLPSTPRQDAQVAHINSDIGQGFARAVVVQVAARRVEVNDVVIEMLVALHDCPGIRHQLDGRPPRADPNAESPGFNSWSKPIHCCLLADQVLHGAGQQGLVMKHGAKSLS